MDSDAANKALDADMALQELGSRSRRPDLCHRDRHGVWTPTLGSRRNGCVGREDRPGRDFTCMRETVNAIEAWLGSLPGHVYANVRQPRSRPSISRI